MSHHPTPRKRFLHVPKEVAIVFWTMIAIHGIIESDLAGVGADLLPLLAFVPARYADFLNYSITDNVANLISLYNVGGFGISYYISPVGYMFVHADWTHLFLNASMLLAFGKTSAQIWGRTKWLIFIALAAAFSAFFAGYISQFDALIGASGVVSALISALLVSAILGLGPMNKATATSQLAMWVVMLVIVPWVAQDWFFDMIGPISWEGHLGGLIFGAVIGPFLSRR